MWIRRPVLTKALHLRHFTQSSSSAAALLHEPEVPLTYLEDLPKPDPKHAEIIAAIPRAISAKERKAGRVPSIVFEQEDGQNGGNKRLISVQTNQIRKLVNHLDVIPPFIDMDLSELDMGQKLVMIDLKVHPTLKLTRSEDEPVCKIMGSRVSDEKKKSK